MGTRDYYDRLLADHKVTQAAERDMLVAFVASIGAERGLCDFARTYLAEERAAPLSRSWALEAGSSRFGERTYPGGERHSGHPDSYPPNFQDR
jgi:hypothetical protein